MKNRCSICNNEARESVNKSGIQYYQCTNCGTVFCDELDNSGLIGGEAEEERNTTQNHLRIGRIDGIVLGMKKEDVHILDWGCGHGMLIRDLKDSGYQNVEGYDMYNEAYSKLPKRDTYHVISCIECIEHTYAPYIELDVIFRSLVNGGVVMIETSFVDVALQEGIPLDDFFYINPKAGHSTIFSHHGLDLLMTQKKFTISGHYNRHVRFFQKLVR